MKKLKHLNISEKRQLKVCAVIMIIVIGLTGLLNYWNASVFQRFFGGLHPVVLVFAMFVLGFYLLYFLLAKDWFVIFKKENLRGLVRYSGLTIVFAAISIALDVKVGFPEEMNIRLPEAWLFYPAIAFFVEILFHVLPLSLLLITLTSFFSKVKYQKLLWVCILIVAFLEPTYQVVFMDSSPAWAVAMVWLNLFVFNLVQLWIFKQYDFIAMLSFRLLYYLIWHIIWGYIRLELLF